jgi:alkylhydroperoxidase/carboxymuconolactone decarboxylase family protein YurZ
MEELMSPARKMQPSTLSFLLAETGGLDRQESLLALCAAAAADGGFAQAETLLRYALQQGVPAQWLEEALLYVYHFAGAVRADTGFAALAAAAAEQAKPRDPFAAIMTGGGDVGAKPLVRIGADPYGEDEDPTSGARYLADFLGPQAAAVRSRFSGRSRTLERWVLADLWGRLFARPVLSRRAQLLAALGALYPLGSREPLADIVSAAAKQGVTKEDLFTLLDLLGRLFDEGAATKSARAAFEKVLGPKPAGPEEFAPGQDPFRWD